MTHAKKGKTIVALRGGLGNQMFQYALGFSLAKTNGTELLLDTTFLNDRFPRKEFTYRTFDLDIFALTPRFTALAKTSLRFPVPGVLLALDLVKIKCEDTLHLRKLIVEKDEYAFDPDVLRVEGDSTLWGRWWSHKYFFRYDREIRQQFAFKIALDDQAEHYARTIRAENSIALHVRRADYVAYENMRAIVGDTDLSYYHRAVEVLAKRVPRPRFFVFSDDIPWCREHLKLPYPAMFMERESEGPKAGYHFKLMSLCKHHIIANSTFSWWAAWLNAFPRKIVIAPKSWYVRNGNHDMLPEDWIAV